MKINQTSRTFPRSLNQAFKDASYACAIERPERSSVAPYVLGVIIAVVSVIAFVAFVKG